MKNVFVYGTLRSNQGNRRLLEQAKLISAQCWTHGKLYDVGCGYPTVVNDNNSRVYGELYEVTDDILIQLDWLEGYAGSGKDNHYERIEESVYTDRGAYTAFVYIYPINQTFDLIEIPSGDWKRQQLLNNDSIYYFAYGSCMDDERFTKHGVAHYFANVVGRGVLKDYELAFTKRSNDGGRADIVEGHGYVEGKVYKVNADAVTYLDKREGAYYNTYRPTFVGVEVDGRLITDVLTYVVVDKLAETAPPHHYAKEIIRGAQGCLSEAYIRRLEVDWKRKFNLNINEIKLGGR